MATTKAKKLRLTTPVGTAKFCSLDRPNTKFNPEGVFTVDLVLSGADGKALLKTLEAEAKKFLETKIKESPKYGKFKMQLPIKPEEDEAGEETGNYVFKAKKNAKFTVKNKSGEDETINVTIPLFDCSQPPKKLDTVRVGRGSKLRVSFDVSPYAIDAQKAIGVTARLQAVQIVDLVEYGGGGTAGDFGFEGTDGGYAADEKPASSSEEAPFESGAGAAEDGDF